LNPTSPPESPLLDPNLCVTTSFHSHPLSASHQILGGDKQEEGGKSVQEQPSCEHCNRLCPPEQPYFTCQRGCLYYACESCVNRYRIFTLFSDNTLPRIQENLEGEATKLRQYSTFQQGSNLWPSLRSLSLSDRNTLFQNLDPVMIQSIQEREQELQNELAKFAEDVRFQVIRDFELDDSVNSMYSADSEPDSARSPKRPAAVGPVQPKPIMLSVPSSTLNPTRPDSLRRPSPTPTPQISQTSGHRYEGDTFVDLAVKSRLQERENITEYSLQAFISGYGEGGMILVPQWKPKKKKRKKIKWIFAER